jgi:hypothetical protein
MANLLTDLILTTAHVYTDTFADITGMSDVVSIESPGSVVILMTSNVPAENFGGDQPCIEYQFTVDGSPVGGELCSHIGAFPSLSGIEMMFAVTGLSAGNHTFAVQGRNRNPGQTGEVDTTKNRTFQVLELDFGASILVDLSSSTLDAAPVAFADVANLTVSATPQAGSLLLFSAGLPQFDDDTGVMGGYQFAIDGALDGPELGSHHRRIDRGDSLSMSWAEIGVSAASHTFSLQWEIRRKAPETDVTRTRYLQVIEIEQFFQLEIDNVSLTADAAPAAFADMDGMSGTATIESTDSISLILANYIQDDAGAQDDRADSRLTVGGSFEGAEQANLKRNTDRAGSTMMNRAVDNESGSTDFALQWEQGQNTPNSDTGRNRTFQVIELLPTGQMEASPDLAITATADLRAFGALSAGPSMAFTLAAALGSIEQMSASPAMAFTLAAALGATEQISASPDLAFDVAAAIQGIGSISANPQMAFSVTAALRNATPVSENRSRHIERFIN